jgi:hypothetical protein
MKSHEWIVLFVVIVAAATLANLVALKIAAGQLQSQAGSSPLGRLLGLSS